MFLLDLIIPVETALVGLLFGKKQILKTFRSSLYPNKKVTHSFFRVSVILRGNFANVSVGGLQPFSAEEFLSTYLLHWPIANVKQVI